MRNKDRGGFLQAIDYTGVGEEVSEWGPRRRENYGGDVARRAGEWVKVEGWRGVGRGRRVNRLGGRDVQIASAYVISPSKLDVRNIFEQACINACRE